MPRIYKSLAGEKLVRERYLTFLNSGPLPTSSCGCQHAKVRRSLLSVAILLRTADEKRTQELERQRQAAMVPPAAVIQ